MEFSTKLLSDFSANSQSLLDWGDKLSTSQLQQQPAPGKWTVSEVLEHLFIVEKGAARLCKPDCEIVERDLEKSSNRMAYGLADVNQRFAGGNALDPKGRFVDYAEWRAAFVSNRAELAQLGEEKGWMGLAATFPHPFFGHLTRAEWVIFVGLHASRHLEQMKAFVE